MNYKGPSIMKIFDEMDSEAETDDLNPNDNKDYSKQEWELFFANREVLREVMRSMKEPKLCEDAIKSAKEAEKTWKTSSLQLRANTLHKIWELLKSTSGAFSLLKNEFSLFIEYFDYYCNILLHIEEFKDWRSHGITLIVLLNQSILLPVATIPAALAAGSSIIVVAPETMQTFYLFLQEIFSKASLPDGVFNVVVDNDKTYGAMLKKVNNVFFCGSYLSAQRLYSNIAVDSFNFFCPNNTAAFVLESADSDSAVDKIISETWAKEEPFFGVSTLVVQESVYEEVLDKLICKMNQYVLKNKLDAKFNDEIISDKIKNIISKALVAGASVHECETKSGLWGPTVIINYQNQDIDHYVPVLRVLLCRTAKEGVSLLNNCRFTLGTSIWSEISSQALEISSKLICPNIWINSHGTFAADVPLQLSGFSGNCVLGGGDGILECISFRSLQTLKLSESAEVMVEPVDENILKNILKMADSAQEGFKIWQTFKEKRQCLIKIAISLMHDRDLHDIIQHYAHCQYIISMSDTFCRDEFCLIKKKIPKGVILLLVNSNEIDKNSVVSLITPAIMLGNSVIIVFKEKNPLIELLIQNFIKILPKNVLNVTVGMGLGIHLVSHPNVQVVWLYHESTVSSEFFQTVKNYSARPIKHFQILPQKITSFRHFFLKECLQNKTVWLPKIDEFP